MQQIHMQSFLKNNLTSAILPIHQKEV